MGTNYYLFKKINWSPSVIPALGCFENIQVEELSNGYVWNKTYYPTATELSDNFYQIIHIGKSSGGWHFALAIYPQENIKTFDDWKKIFYSEGNIIKDEYNALISPEEMCSIITEREKPDWDEQRRAELEHEELACENDFLKHKGGARRSYSTYDELLNSNSAIRGKNGLWAHKPDRYTFGTSGTYDYIVSDREGSDFA